MVNKVLLSIVSAGLLAIFSGASAEANTTATYKNLMEQQSEKKAFNNEAALYPKVLLDEKFKSITNLNNFRFQASNIAASTDYLVEQEPNDDFGYADLLSYNKPTLGQLLPYDDFDFYKIVVPRDGMIGVGGSSNTYAINLLYAVVEKDWAESSKLQYLGYEDDGELEIQYYQAKAGTYYVVATDDDFSEGWNDNTESDIYAITTAFADNVAPGKPTVNKVDNNDVAVTGKAEAGATVTIKSGTTVIGSAKASSTGAFSAKIAVQKLGTKLTATAKDSSGNVSVSTNVTVVDGVAPTKPIVNKVDNNDVAVTGKAEANSTVTVKRGSTVLSSVKATSTGTFSAKIAVQKAGAVLTIAAKDSAGNTSASALITVVDVIAPTKPVIYKVDSNDLKVTGKAEANSTVTVKVGTTTLGYAKASSTGYYSVPIKAQKRGVIITVTAKDKAGNTSAKASLTVVNP
ncbi:Ig-like domain-containing protein [Planococcus sp. 1R117A]|uniref:Ig-like domain-containing protein n=1 Tax=Planococcus sp. 1R117A TaxID=3447020 RepID=UPI003EDBC516